MDNRRMCPNCRAFITTSDRVCPYCGVQAGPRAVDRREPGALIGGLIPAQHFTTFLILLINVGLYVATYWVNGPNTPCPNDVGCVSSATLWGFGAKYGPSIWQGHEWWRLVTAGFLHGSVLHIALNSWALFVLGGQLEEVFGTSRFLVIYFVSTGIGFFCSAMVNPVVSAGASAGIMGFIGAMVAFGIAHGSDIGRRIRNQYLGWLALNLVIGFWPGSHVDNWAHIGGFAGGFVVAYIAGTPLRSNQARETAWRVAAGACLVLTVCSFWLMYHNYPTPEQWRELFQQG
jgi:rhomboid protease GluP